MRACLSMIEQGGYSNFYAFSTAGVVIKGTDPDTSQILQDNTGSVEGLHNNYHVYVGGFGGNDSNTGHMSCVPVAAFDPVFWIHHWWVPGESSSSPCIRVPHSVAITDIKDSQIDRLFAIWQAVNPEHWFDELPSSQRALADDILLPFRKDPLTTDKKSRYWTSNQARDPEVLGYTYPDIADKKKSVDQLRTDFAAKYGWSRRLTPFQHFGQPPADMQPLDLSKAQVYQYTSGVPSAGRFATLAPVAGALPRTQLFAKVAPQTNGKSAAATMPGVQAPSRAVSLPQGAPRSAAPEAAQQQAAHAQAVPDQAPPLEAGQPPAKAPLVPKVSHEWYIDCVVER